MVENAKLKNDIEQLKKQLLEKEKKRGGMFSLAPSRGFHCGSNVCLSLNRPGCCYPLLYLVIEVVLCACLGNI